MTKIMLVGALGMMGKNVAACVAKDDDAQIICGIDVNKGELSFPVFTNFTDVKVMPDVIIDFSHVSVLDRLLNFATENNIPQTGEAGVAAIAGVMALAAVAFVATRKKDEE